MREKYFKPKEYDIQNELGPKNRFDDIAGKAILLGLQLKNNKLTALGTELGDMIRTIPFNHDHFYKVIAKKNQVESYIQELGIEKDKKNENNFKNEKLRDNEKEWTYELTEKENQFCIIVHNYRFSGCTSKREESIIQMLKNEFDLNKLRLKNEHYDHSNYYSTDYDSYLDKNEEKKYEHVFHIHEDGVNVGCAHLFYFSDITQAKRLWEKIKLIIKS